MFKVDSEYLTFSSKAHYVAALFLTFALTTESKGSKIASHRNTLNILLFFSENKSVTQVFS